MMFDPPDYPYKDLSETYDPDLLFSNDTVTVRHLTDDSKNTNNVATVIDSVENYISFHSNDSGRFFNVDSCLFQEHSLNTAENTELYVVQSDSIFNYEPTLLDENTVNQFLIPLQDSTETNTSTDDTGMRGPDVLALHSCAACHEIFTTEADLLDHTISLHASSNPAVQTDDNIAQMAEEEKSLEDNSKVDFESEWLVCLICQRVLSTAVEMEPTEQLCCVDPDGRGTVSTQKLNTMYVCDSCKGLFADGEALDKHRLTCYIDNQNYYDNQPTDIDKLLESNISPCPKICFCNVCGKEYPIEEEKAHSIECHRPVQRNVRRTYTDSGNNKMWNCGSCNQLFATARELYRHKRGEDRPEGSPLMAYVCEECDKVLGSMCALHTHKKMHKVTKPGYPCRVCGRRFNQSGHLAIHMRMHTGERPYPCDLCPKAFKVKVERDDHRRTHTGERPFACAACPKTFTAAARLREHARIHTDHRPYRCETCGAAFRRPYARTVHTLIHTGEKPHACDVCGTAFRRSGDMWKHKRTLHGVQGVNVES